MPTNRRRTTRTAKPALQAYELAYLTDDNTLVDANTWDGFFLDDLRAGMNGRPGATQPEELWTTNKNEFLPAFIRRNPGKRPFPWWQWDAPRQTDTGTGCYWEGKRPSARLQLGGTGVPDVCASFDHGIPSMDEVNPADPPIFESQAVYLQRHGLLTSAEKRWLAKHPEGLEPETVTE